MNAFCLCQMCNNQAEMIMKAVRMVIIETSDDDATTTKDRGDRKKKRKKSRTLVSILEAIS